MKKQAILLSLLTYLAFTACQNSGGTAPKAEASEPATSAVAADPAGDNYAVNTEASVSEWEGYKPGKYSHHGTIQLQSGNLGVSGGNLVSGSFVIDVNSLANADLAENPAKKAKLEGHLKSGDFFEVEKYPTGKFEITKVEPLTADSTGATHHITGNLTLKNITNSITIPAKVGIQNGSLMAETPEFTINRTKWKVEYGSGVIGTIKDELIADDVKLKIKLAAAAQAQ